MKVDLWQNRQNKSFGIMRPMSSAGLKRINDSEAGAIDQMGDISLHTVKYRLIQSAAAAVLKHYSGEYVPLCHEVGVAIV